MKKISSIILSAVMLFMLCACGKTDMESDTSSPADDTIETTDAAKIEKGGDTLDNMSENFVLISGGHPSQCPLPLFWKNTMFQARP